MRPLNRRRRTRLLPYLVGQSVCCTNVHVSWGWAGGQVTPSSLCTVPAPEWEELHVLEVLGPVHVPV